MRDNFCILSHNKNRNISVEVGEKMANIGKHIKKFRLQKNMTQGELAEKIFVSRQTISNYENNKSQPGIEVLVKIAEIFEYMYFEIAILLFLIMGAILGITKKKKIQE